MTSAINLTSMPDANDEHDKPPVVDSINDAPVTHANAPELVSSQLLRALRPRALGELLDLANDADLDRSFEVVQRVSRRGSEGDAVWASAQIPSSRLILERGTVF